MPAISTTIVPMSVTPLQARKALRQAGLAETFREAMSKAPYDVQEEWEYATQIDRTNSLIIQFGTTLGLTSKQMDDLFILAQTL